MSGGGRGSDAGGGRWRDRRHVDRGAQERAADARRRRQQEWQRSALDRQVREQVGEGDEGSDDDVVVPDGAVVRRAPRVGGIDDVLRTLVEQRGWDERLRGADLAQRWDEVVGPELGARSRPGRLAGGVLQVVVESPAWATQLRYLTTQIAGRASAVGGSEVTEVVVVVGDVGEAGG